MVKLKVPSKIYESFSQFSNETLFVIQAGSRRVLGTGIVNYSIYSEDPNDDFKGRYWGKVIDKLRDKGKDGSLKGMKRALIMGLAGGTLAYLLNKYFEIEEIIGIEIDPEVVKLGKKFFYLNKCDNLKVVEQDALSWMGKNKEGEKFDLIILDIFKVDKTPEEVDSHDFYKEIGNFLTEEGILVLNKNFRGKNWEEQTENFKKEKLGKTYQEVEIERVKRPMDFNNLLFYVRK